MIAQQCVRWDRREWIEPLGAAVDAAARHRHRGRWSELIDALEKITTLRDLVQLHDPVQRGNDDELRSDLTEALRRLSPWEKGPFQIGPVRVDGQWRSDQKWDRIANLVDWRGGVGIDVGGGNGYYADRMIQAGAGVVWVVDPTPTVIAQGLAVCGWADRKTDPMFLPIADHLLPIGGGNASGRSGDFDFALSMGVLYHHTAPLEHLRRMAALVRRGGVVLVETIYLPGVEQGNTQPGGDAGVTDVGGGGGGGWGWMPPGRYASMRNVWMIPTLDGLVTWLRRAGLGDVQVCHRGVTDVREQRSTVWSPGHSLAEALDPSDPNRTVEGHPRPHRVVVRCRRS